MTGPPKPSNIQIVFVSPNGDESNGPLLKVSDGPPRVFDEVACDRTRCTSEFLSFLRAGDSHGLQATMRAMDRLTSWHDAFERLMAEDNNGFTVGKALLAFWITYGFHIADSMKADPILLDAMKNLLPPYVGTGMTLYRGESLPRHREGIRGMSWTTSLETARCFADRRGLGEGVILSVGASPEMIITRVGGHMETEEFEYLVDTRLLSTISEIE